MSDVAIYLRKLQTSSNLTHVCITILNDQQIFGKSGQRVLKYGKVNLYGQTIEIPRTILRFKILIYNMRNMEKVCVFNINQQMISQFTKNKNVYILESQIFKLTWEAQIIYEDGQDNLDLSSRGISESQDEEVEKHKFNANEISQLKPVQKLRRKRNSMKLRISDTTSQPPTPKKSLIDQVTDITLPSKNIQNTPIMIKTERINENQGTKNPQIAQICSSKLYFKSKKFEQPKKVKKLIKNQNKANLSIIKSQKSFLSLQNIQYNQTKLHKSRSSIFNKLTIKDAVATSLLGIVSGIAASIV